MNVDVNERETDKSMLPYEECDMTHGRPIYVIIKKYRACKLIKYVIFILILALALVLALVLSLSLQCTACTVNP